MKKVFALLALGMVLVACRGGKKEVKFETSFSDWEEGDTVEVAVHVPADLMDGGDAGGGQEQNPLDVGGEYVPSKDSTGCNPLS